jgi:hypothetical protein
MKKNNLYRLLTVFVVLFAITVQGCKDDEPTLAEKTAKILKAHDWKLSKLTVDGTDKTSDYEGIVLKITGSNTFSSINGAPFFPASGTWAFKSETARLLTVSLGIEQQLRDVTIKSIDDNTLVISFNWDETTLGGGRQASVEGEHELTFVKN